MLVTFPVGCGEFFCLVETQDLEEDKGMSCLCVLLLNLGNRRECRSVSRENGALPESCPCNKSRNLAVTNLPNLYGGIV